MSGIDAVNDPDQPDDRATLDAWLRRAYGAEGSCPPPESFLDLVEGHLDAKAAERLAAHAAACAACGAELELARAFALGDAGSEAGADRLESLVAEVERRLPVQGPEEAAAQRGEASKVLPFGSPRSSNSVRGAKSLLRLPQPWVRWAMAATLLLATGLVFRAFVAPPLPTLPPPENGGVVRGGEVELLSPLGELQELPLELRWAPYPGATAYRIRLIAVDDAVLWQAESREPRIALPEGILKTLHRAVAYRWRVEALDSAGRTLAGSEPVRFLARPAAEAP